MADVTPIENVPASPNSSNEPTYLYNPLDQDFVFYHDRVKNPNPYTVPAKSKKLFPEYLAYHGAKHLAVLIVYKEHEEGLKFKTKEDRDPDAWKKVAEAMPGYRVQEVMVSLISVPETLVEKVEEEPEKKPEEPAKEAEQLKEEKVDYEAMSWGDLRKYATEKGIYKVGMKRLDILEILDKL